CEDGLGEGGAAGGAGWGPAFWPRRVRSCHSMPAWIAAPMVAARCFSRSAALTPPTASTTAESTYSGSRAPGFDSTSSMAVSKYRRSCLAYHGASAGLAMTSKMVVTEGKWYPLIVENRSRLHEGGESDSVVPIALALVAHCESLRKPRGVFKSFLARHEDLERFEDPAGLGGLLTGVPD